MRVTFLGTGTSQGIPVIACDCEVCNSLDYTNKRLRTSIHIDIEGLSLVVDTGPDFRQQMLREKVGRLDAVLFTHEHKDHTAGLDDVRSFNFAQGEHIPIYARPSVLDQIKTEFAYIFGKNSYPGIPRINIMPINGSDFEIKGHRITPIEVKHLSLPVYGFKIGTFSYITDANFIEQKELDKLIGTDTLVINALQREKHISHFNLEDALQMIERINPKKAYLTHLSHKMGLHDEITDILPDRVELAYDGLQINI